MLPSKKPLSVYVHVPFCIAACPYCNFNFRLLRNFDAAFVERYVASLVREWQTVRNQWGEGYDLVSLYFGGGTPSVLAPSQIQNLVRAIAGTAADIEVTLEANPEGLRAEDLDGFRSAGINRLSLGVQSFQDDLLKTLGRQHNAATVFTVIEQARKAGFKNISCDLIGAVPGQTVERLEKDLRMMIDLAPEHVSYYSLTFEEKTAFYQRMKLGTLTPLGDDEQVAMLTTTSTCLEAAGYRRYEISNFAKPGFESRHNSGYWLYRDYAGLGAGAHGFQKKPGSSERTVNASEPRNYIELVEKTGTARESVETLNGKRAMGEYVFTALRRLEGISPQHFQAEFSVALSEVFGGEINHLVQLNLLEKSGEVGEERLRLTARGILLSDSVFEEFV